MPLQLQVVIGHVWGWADRQLFQCVVLQFLFLRFGGWCTRRHSKNTGTRSVIPRIIAVPLTPNHIQATISACINR